MTRVLSCIQPTGDVHLGNYLGALRNWVNGQHDADAFHGIVDLHALTITETPGVIGDTTLRLAAMLFAVGLDLDVATVFVQSHVTEHSQLGWIMECTVSVGELRRMVQFKDTFLSTVVKGVDASVTATVKEGSEGKFTNTPYVGTLENGGTLLAPFHDLESMVSADTKTELETIRKGIIDGSITIASPSQPKS